MPVNSWFIAPLVLQILDAIYWLSMKHQTIMFSSCHFSLRWSLRSNKYFVSARRRGASCKTSPVLEQGLKGGLVILWIQQQGSLIDRGASLRNWILVSYTLNFVTEEQAMFQLHLNLRLHNTSQPLHEQAMSDWLKPSHSILKIGQMGPHLTNLWDSSIQPSCDLGKEASNT